MGTDTSDTIRGGEESKAATLPDYRAISAQACRDGLVAYPACEDPAQKHPCIAWKEYQYRFPTDAEMMYWRARYPHRNGVYITGALLGRIVVDCDNEEASQEVCRRGMPDTQMVRTRRGIHYHLRHPGFRVGNTASVLYPGVDIRGDGGIAVAVGSIHASGFVYRWVAGHSPHDMALASVPDWLIDWLQGRAARTSVGEGRAFDGTVSAWTETIIFEELERLRATVQGERNGALARISFKLGQLAGGGEADGEALLDYLRAIASEWPDVRKSFNTIERCFAAGTAEPRNTPVITKGRRRRGKRQSSLNPWY